jgi:glutamine amidotransferase
VSRPRIGIVDYGMGNRRSVEKAIERSGARPVVSSIPAELRAADGVVLPGVGAFPAAVRSLAEHGLDRFVVDVARAGTPLLGICLGMQLLFERSEELEAAEGLGLLPGYVGRLRSGGQRIPHIGWSEVRFERESPLLRGLPPSGCAFYHAHSFAAHPACSAHVVASAQYGEPFATIVQDGGVFGVQFHPEKSAENGLRLLESFIAVCADRVDRSVTVRQVVAGG